MKRHVLLALALSGLVFIGGLVPRGHADTNAPSWTIMIYGHGDHNLAPSLVGDMLSMEEAGSGPDFNVLLQTDFDASQAEELEEEGLPRKLAAGTTRFLVTRSSSHDKISSRILARLPEMNHDNPATLSAFIAWAAQTRPADRYGLILWDHGGQWEGFGGDTQDGTLEDTGAMTPAQIRSALREAMPSAGIDRFEFMAFDTCLMAGAEVLADMAGLAGVLIACPEIDYGDGWDYHAALEWLKTNPAATAREFGLREAEFWKQRHIRADKPADEVLAGHSVIALDRYGAFEEAFRSFAKVLREESGPDKFNIPRQRRKTTEYSVPELVDLGAPTEYVDLGEFAKRLADDPRAGSRLSGAARVVANSVDAMVLARVQGSARTSAGGLSIWYPVNGWGKLEEEPEEDDGDDDENQDTSAAEAGGDEGPDNPREKFSEYEKISFARRTGWAGFLDHVHDLSMAGATSAPVLAIRGKVAGEIQLAQSAPLALSLEITEGKGAFLISAGILDPALTKKPGEFAYLGDVAVLPADGTGTYAVAWDLCMPCFAADAGRPLAPLGGVFMSGSGTLMVSYAKYRRGRLGRYRDVILITRMAGKTGTILEVLEAENDDAAPTSLEAVPGATLRPVYLVERRRGPDPEKWKQYEYVAPVRVTIPEGGVGSIPVIMAPRPPGQCLVEVEAEDIYGNRSDPAACPVRIVP